MSTRACLRCISKKRRCDHERPTCLGCKTARESCVYPPPQIRRGPIAGLGRMQESRLEKIENALWYILGFEEIRKTLRDLMNEAQDVFYDNPLMSLGKEERIQWYESHPLDKPSDIIKYYQSVSEVTVTETGSGSTVPEGASGSGGQGSSSNPVSNGVSGLSTLNSIRPEASDQQSASTSSLPRSTIQDNPTAGPAIIQHSTNPAQSQLHSSTLLAPQPPASDTSRLPTGVSLPKPLIQAQTNGLDLLAVLPEISMPYSNDGAGPSNWSTRDTSLPFGSSTDGQSNGQGAAGGILDQGGLATLSEASTRDIEGEAIDPLLGERTKPPSGQQSRAVKRMRPLDESEMYW